MRKFFYSNYSYFFFLFSFVSPFILLLVIYHSLIFSRYCFWHFEFDFYYYFNFMLIIEACFNLLIPYVTRRNIVLIFDKVELERFLKQILPRRGGGGGAHIVFSIWLSENSKLNALSVRWLIKNTPSSFLLILVFAYFRLTVSFWLRFRIIKLHWGEAIVKQ